MKRCAVYRMDNRRHAERRGRRPPKNAPLRAVRMHDIRIKLAQHLLDPPIRPPIAPRVNGPLQLWHDLNRHSPCPAPLDQTSLRSNRRPGH